MLRDLMRKLRLDRRQSTTAQEEARNEETTAETSENDTASVTLLDHDVLECPICCELLRIPIFQCDNGHLSCSMCIEKVKNVCPSCKLPIGYNRCRAMERVIEATLVSCTNAKYGCKVNTSYRNRSSHEKQCIFAPCSCPFRGCNYTGSYKDLNKHVSVKHKEDLIPFTWETPLLVNSIISKNITILKEKRDGELMLVHSFKGFHGICVSVSCIAPVAVEIGNFVCNLKMSSLPSVMKQVLIVKKIQKMNDEEPKDDFMLIPNYMLQGVIMKICIVRGGSARVIHV